MIEKEAVASQQAVADPLLRQFAAQMESAFRGSRTVRAAPLVRRLGGVRAEGELERLATVVPIRLLYRRQSGGLQLDTIRLLDAEALTEVAHPGVAARRASVLSSAQASIATLDHPEARHITEILSSDTARGFGEKTVRALAGLARLVAAGETRPARAFAADVLDDSKALAPLRVRLEKLVGPLERLGIRESGALVVVGGSGLLQWRDRTIDLAQFDHVGVATRDVLALDRLDLPPEGLLVVENLVPFHAALDRLRGSSVVLWSAGFPGPGVLKLVAMASASKRVRIWCDLDLGGVRIARLIAQAAADRADAVLMDPHLISEASVCRPLSKAQRVSIERELAACPDGMLTATLHSVLAHDGWVEQETLLDRLVVLSAAG